MSSLGVSHLLISSSLDAFILKVSNITIASSDLSAIQLDLLSDDQQAHSEPVKGMGSSKNLIW